MCVDLDLEHHSLVLAHIHPSLMTLVKKEVAIEILPIIRVYKDGTAERLMDFPFSPPTPHGDPTTGVLSKDVPISPDFSARLYLPPNAGQEKLPILVYFHGGGFCFESGLSLIHHRFVNALVSQAKVVLVNVEYRLAPEHLLPTAYEDSWAAVQWVASHSLPNTTIQKDPWLTEYADFTRLFLGGDSAGGNIVNNLTLRAGKQGLNGDVKILGAFINHPHFWGSEPIGSEASKVENRETCLPYRCWMFSYPGVEGGIDNPMINPAMDKPCLAGLACSRMLVNVAELDDLKDRGVAYYEAVKESGWKGEIELVEDKGENHYFHMIYHGSENSTTMIKRLADFITK